MYDNHNRYITSKTNAAIGAWKGKTDRQTEQPTVRRTDGLTGEFHINILLQELVLFWVVRLLPYQTTPQTYHR